MNNTLQRFPALYKSLRCYLFYRGGKKINVCFVTIQTFHTCTLTERQQIENAKNFISVKSTYSGIKTQIPPWYQSCLIHISVTATADGSSGCKMSEA